MTYRHSPLDSLYWLTRVIIHAVGGTPIGQSEASDQRRPPRLHDMPVVYAIRPRMSANLRNDKRKNTENSKHEIQNDSKKTIS